MFCEFFSRALINLMVVYVLFDVSVPVLITCSPLNLAKIQILAACRSWFPAQELFFIDRCFRQTLFLEAGVALTHSTPQPPPLDFAKTCEKCSPEAKENSTFIFFPF
jgi:hypothetical protein